MPQQNHGRDFSTHRPQRPTIIGQPLDEWNRIRPKLPIGPRGEFAHMFPTYIGFERSHHAAPHHT